MPIGPRTHKCTKCGCDLPEGSGKPRVATAEGVVCHDCYQKPTR